MKPIFLWNPIWYNTSTNFWNESRFHSPPFLVFYMIHEPWILSLQDGKPIFTFNRSTNKKNCCSCLSYLLAIKLIDANRNEVSLRFIECLNVNIGLPYCKIWIQGTWIMYKINTLPTGYIWSSYLKMSQSKRSNKEQKQNTSSSFELTHVLWNLISILSHGLQDCSIQQLYFVYSNKNMPRRNQFLL